MRVLCCLMIFLSGCTAHAVRCDAHLRPVNPPGIGAADSTGVPDRHSP